MRLRGIQFGSCLDAAGLRGFWRDGYPFHYLPLIKRWYDFRGSTFTAKTTTTNPRKGNMPCDKNWDPIALLPKCIWIDFRRGIALNAVGLGGPGAKTVLEQGFGERAFLARAWPMNTPYFISWGPEGQTKEERIEEFEEFVRFLMHYLSKRPEIRLLLGLQINLSCPNSDTDPAVLIEEAGGLLDIAERLGIPILIKVNLLVPVDALARIAAHPQCDGICIANTIPFGALPERIPWKKWFPKGSPLKDFGGGGLSGAPLLPLVAERIREMRAAKIGKPINAGGGILKPQDVDTLVAAGLRRRVDSVFIGSIAMLRPWNIQPVIQRAHHLLD